MGMSVSVAIGAQSSSAGARPTAGELLGDLGRGLVDLGVVFRPGLGIPDLEVVGDPDDDAGALLQVRVLDQMLGDPNPAGRIQRLVVRAAVEATPHHAALAAERVELAEDLLLELGVLGDRIHLDAGIEAGGENRTTRELRTEPGRDRDPVLGVETVLVVAAKRQPLLLFRVGAVAPAAIAAG